VEIAVAIAPPTGLHNLYFVAVAAGERDRKPIALNWVEFHDSPAAAEQRKRAREEARKLIALRQVSAPTRTFVRNWTLGDLRMDLPGLEKGRSVDRGQRLFTELACAKCHKLGSAGGTVGPDLSDVMQRMAKQKSPREALLTEVLEPSKVIDEKYRTTVVTLDNGQVLAGIIVGQNAKAIRIAADPANPDVVREISRGQIEEMKPSDVSLMPAGLLNTLSKDEILDLLAFLAGGAKKN
jgi:putative heme-binding domain-containing protein